MFASKTDNTSRGSRAVAIIPARLGSTRFPRKALADETGTSLVVHVCERAHAASSVGRVVVATDAQEIADAVTGAGFESVLTGAHPNGTSRLAEAAEKLGLAPDQVIVNVQGDEPEIEPDTIDAAIDSLHVRICAEIEQSGSSFGRERFAQVGTVVSPFAPGEDPANPNIVKAVLGVIEPESLVASALYFSRALIPHHRNGVRGYADAPRRKSVEPGAHGQPEAQSADRECRPTQSADRECRPTQEPDSRTGTIPFKHIGIYSYAVADLQRYIKLIPAPLEQTERLEQLRWLEYGMRIAAAVRTVTHTGIDTPEQYAAFVERHNASAASRLPR